MLSLWRSIVLIGVVISCEQLTFAKDRTFSLVGVYNQSNVVSELTTDSPYYIGADSSNDSTYNFGVLLENPMQGKWSFETGLIFLQRGFQFAQSSDQSSDQSIKDVYRWKNFYVPLIGRFHPTPMFTGSIGLYAAQAVGDVGHFQTSSPNSISYRTMKECGYRTFDWGMTYSAGLNLEISSSILLLIEVRFNDSWSNLMDTSLPNVDKREKATIHETQLYLGFMI